MRIIKEGNIKGPPVAEVKCHECDTIFEFVQSEGKLVFDQRAAAHVEINCPFCGHSLMIATNLFRRPLVPRTIKRPT